MLFQQHKRWLYTWTSSDGQYQNQIDYILCSQRWKSSIQSANKICGSDLELLIAKCRLKLKKVGKTTRPFSSVQFSRSVVSDSLWPHESQHARPPCPSPTLGVHSDSRPLSPWCHPAISSSVVPFSSCPQLMLLNCGVGEDSWESLGLQGDPTSPFWRRSILGFLWKEWC